MLLRPLAQTLPLPLQCRGHQALEALAGLNAQEQLELACRIVAGVLAVARSRFEGTREDREAYDVLCDAVEGWFEAGVARLRFSRAH